MSKVIMPWEDPKLEQTLADEVWQRVGDDFHGDGWERVVLTGPHGRWVGRDRWKRTLAGARGGIRYFRSPSAAIRAVMASYQLATATECTWNWIDASLCEVKIRTADVADALRAFDSGATVETSDNTIKIATRAGWFEVA